MSSSTQTLQAHLAEAASVAPSGSRWRHKKGGIYVVLGAVLHSDDGAPMVLYQRVGGPEFNAVAEFGIYFARPVGEWTVDRFVRLD